jgi:hypothetical protein
LQDSSSDPRNDDDYDTWEYGTEPLPNDKTWNLEKIIEDYREAAKSDDYFFGDYDAHKSYNQEGL